MDALYQLSYRGTPRTILPYRTHLNQINTLTTVSDFIGAGSRTRTYEAKGERFTVSCDCHYTIPAHMEPLYGLEP
jgi:hypothetical protein